MQKDTREKLIQVAAEFFAKKGYSGVSIRELAEAAGVNSAMISYYFSGKEGLYSAVMKTHLSYLEAISESVKELEPLECLRQYAYAVQNLYRQMPNTIGLFFGELSNHTHCYDSLIKEFITKNQSFLRETIREGQERGQIRSDIQPNYACAAFAGFVHFYFLVNPMVKDLPLQAGMEEEEYIQQAIDIYLSGIQKKEERQ